MNITIFSRMKENLLIDTSLYSLESHSRAFFKSIYMTVRLVMAMLDLRQQARV